MSHRTANQLLAADVDNIFTDLASQVRVPKLNLALMALFHLHRRLIEKMDALAAAADRGASCRIMRVMDLILWRHAEAEEMSADADDLRRALTPRGEKEAARMGAWLDRQLPETARILCSPALRCEQTAMALGRKFKIRPELAPGAPLQALLEAAQWPRARERGGVLQTVVVAVQPPEMA